MGGGRKPTTVGNARATPGASRLPDHPPKQFATAQFLRVDTITIVVSYTTGGGTAPSNTSPPTISGSATAGSTLTRNQGVWSGSTPITYTYQWRSCDSAGANCADISGATSTSYTAASADVGKTIRVNETATNAYGNATATSGPNRSHHLRRRPHVVDGHKLHVDELP